MAQIDLAARSFDLEEPAVVAVDPLQEARDRRFARSRSADDAEHRPGRDRELTPDKAGILVPP